MAKASNPRQRGGIDFLTLSRGYEKNYTTGFLVNLDMDLLSLIGKDEAKVFELNVKVLVAHTKRIFRFIHKNSNLPLDQFCFGSTHVQLNPVSPKLKRMDPSTWKKEGIANAWSGARSLKRSCCKNCCVDLECEGCKKCNGCLNSPIRGNYDGMVILAAITKDILPFSTLPVDDVTNVNLKNKDQYMDHERFAVYLESELTSHFMFKEKDYALKCASTSKVAYAMDESISSKPAIDPAMLSMIGASKDDKSKKCPGYVIYLGYRLKRRSLVAKVDIGSSKFKQKVSLVQSHQNLRGFQTLSGSEADSLAQKVEGKAITFDSKLMKDKINQEIYNETRSEKSEDEDHHQMAELWRQTVMKDVIPGIGTGEYEIEDLEDHEYGTKAPIIHADENEPIEDDDAMFDEDGKLIQDEEIDDEKMLEELQEKQLMFKLGALEDDYKSVRTRIVDLQNGETFIDKRLLNLETTIQTFK